MLKSSYHLKIILYIVIIEVSLAKKRSHITGARQTRCFIRDKI